MHCGKMADLIRMPFGVVSRTGTWIGQVVAFGDRATERGNFGGKYGAPHCNQWGFFAFGNSNCAAVRLLLNCSSVHRHR